MWTLCIFKFQNLQFLRCSELFLLGQNILIDVSSDPSSETERKMFVNLLKRRRQIEVKFLSYGYSHKSVENSKVYSSGTSRKACVISDSGNDITTVHIK